VRKNFLGEMEMLHNNLLFIFSRDYTTILLQNLCFSDHFFDVVMYLVGTATLSDIS